MSTPIAGYAVMPIVPSLRGLDAEINRQLGSTTTAAKKAGTAAGKSYRQAFGDIGIDSSSLTSFGTKAVAVGAVAAFGLGKAAMAAADLSAAVSTVDQVFGASAAGIQEWSKGAADSLYLSQRAALESATTFGAFGKAAGLQGTELNKFSTDLVALAADMAAFKNVSTEEALTALSSGLAGETEPLRKYQIMLNEAAVKQEAVRLGIIATTNDALTPQGQVLARNSIIFQQSADIAGQAAREYDEAGSQMKRAGANFEDASAAFGESLAPILAGGADAISDITGAFKSLDEGTQGGAAAVATVATGLTLLVGGASLAAGGVMKLADGYGRLKAASAGANPALARTASVARTAAVGLGGIASAAIALQAASALNDAGRDLGRFSNTVQALQFDGSIDDVRLLSEAVDQANGPIDEFQNKLLNFTGLVATVDIGDGIQKPVSELQRTLDSMIDDGKFEQAAALVDRLQESLDSGATNEGFGNRNVFKDLDTDILPEYRKELDLATGAQEDMATGAGEMGGSLDAADDAADALAKSVDSLGRRTALASLEFDAAAAGAAAFGSAMERAQSADNLLKSGLGVSSAMRDLRKGFFGEAEAAEEAANETDTLAEAMDALNKALAHTDPSLTKTEIGFGRLAAAAAGFREAMGRNPIGSQISSALDLGEAYTDFSKTMRRLPGEIDLIDASMGKYRPRTMEAIRTMLQLGEASQEYLATLLESGKGQDYVRGEADRLRQAYIEQFRAAGKTEAEIAKYIETLGLTPAQVETAIKLSGVEAARFEIQSYLSLLDGRIPESVAASVTAKISAGNLEAAAAELAALAASNPVEIPVDIDTSSVEKAKEELLELPQSFDFAKAALGGYTAEQERGLEAVLALGDATKDYLTELVSAGKSEQAVTEAARLREEYRKQFEQFGITGAAFDEYADKLLGLDPADIQVAIDMASFESDVFKVQTLLGLLEADMTSEERFEVAAKLRTGDLDGALGVLDQKIVEWETEQDGLQVWADFDEANTQTAAFIEGIVGTEVDVPVGAETSLAFEGVDSFRSDILASVNFVNVAANMDPADKSVDGWRFGVAATTTDTNIDANTDPAVGTIFDTIANLPAFEIQIKPVFAEGAFKGLPTFGIPGIATGGLISGPGSGTSDSILAMVSNGEYVIRAAAVRDIGVETLDRINAGQFDTLDRGEINTAGVAVTQADKSVSIDYTVIEAQEHPTPADIVRVVGSGLFAGGR